MRERQTRSLPGSRRPTCGRESLARGQPVLPSLALPVEGCSGGQHPLYHQHLTHNCSFLLLPSLKYSVILTRTKCWTRLYTTEHTAHAILCAPVQYCVVWVQGQTVFTSSLTQPAAAVWGPVRRTTNAMHYLTLSGDELLFRSRPKTSCQ